MSRIAIYRGPACLAEQTAEGETCLVFEGLYREGDCITFESDARFARVRVDQCLEPASLYLPTGTFTFRLPLAGDNLAAYPPMAFQAGLHLISLAPDSGNAYRNLALNPLDQRGTVTAYPHVTATVETRDESVFCARNVIDGLISAAGHGAWPYQSWGIGARTDASLTLDFGREVEIDTLDVYLRADFPHDAFWTQATAVFSDGSEHTFALRGIEGRQRVAVGTHRVRWVRLDRLVKCDMPSAFPALRQLMVYGRDAD